jgi:hypothetical protein
MNLEQLQAMPDDNLNIIAAEMIGWKKWGLQESGQHNGWTDPSGIFMRALCFRPTTDMNDAMELWNKLHSEGWELSLSCDHKITTPWDCRMFYKEKKRVISHEKTAPRAITMTAILAKYNEIT